MQRAWDLCISRQRKVRPEMCTSARRPMMLSSTTSNSSKLAMTTWCSSLESKVIRQILNRHGLVASLHIMNWMYRVTTSAYRRLQDIMQLAAISLWLASFSVILLSLRPKSTSKSIRAQWWSIWRRCRQSEAFTEIKVRKIRLRMNDKLSCFYLIIFYIVKKLPNLFCLLVWWEIKILNKVAKLKSRSVQVSEWSFEYWLLSLIDLHLFFNLVLCVADDVWTAILVLLNETLLNPIVNERGSSLVSLCCLVQLWQLSLENLDVLTLIFDLRSIGLAICLNDVVVSKLGLHVDLSATSFTTRL